MATPNTSFHDPGPHNVFIPSAGTAGARLQVEFSRNPASFPLMRYMQIVPGQKLDGLYAELSSSDPVTIVDEAESVWPDGQERPRGNLRPFRWKQWRGERKQFGFTLGSLSVDQADFEVVAAHGRAAAARAMTDRTLDGQTVLNTTGNWPSANTVANVTTLLGGADQSWTVLTEATAAAQLIKLGFNAVKQTIAKQTGGVVTPGQLLFVVNPVGAGQMAASGEVREYMVNHESAIAALQGTERRIVDDWGLPPFLYGIEIVVEDAVRQTTSRNMDGSGTIGYLMADNDAFFLSRIGGLVGAGSPNQRNAAPTFTTLTGFFQEEMSVETEIDAWNRLSKGGVTDTRDIVLTAGNSGMFIQDIDN